MFQNLPSIILSIFTQFKVQLKKIAFLLLISSPAYSSPAKLIQYELSGVVFNNSESVAVLFDKKRSEEIILKVGDVLGECVLDYVRRSRVSFYCDDQVMTLTLRSLKLDLATRSDLDVWSQPVAVSLGEQKSLFDQPENFITAFNLVPYVDEGELKAFEVKATPDDEIAEKLDLQQGDLIVAVNGVSASNAEEFSNAFEQIKFTQTIEIELIRDDIRHYKSYLLQR